MSILNATFLIFCALLLGIAVGGYIAYLWWGKKSGEQGGGMQAEDLLRLRKGPAGDALQVVLSGQVFNSVDKMSGVQRTLAGYIARDFRSWLSLPPEPDKTPAAETQAAAETPTAEGVSETAPVQPEVVTPEMTSQPEAQDSLLVESGGEKDAKKPKRGGIIGVITRALASDVPTNRVVTVSIAKQVNQILQKKLKGTPLESRGICLMELPGQDMVVMIGMDKYDSVSAVPDDEIRTVIQSAVNEWLVKSAS